MMIAYAARTGTRRNLALMRVANRDAGADVWRLMVSARDVLRTEGFRYALDNGAWTAFSEWVRSLQARGLLPKIWTPADLFALPSAEWASNRLDLKAFERAVALLGAGADFIVLPDIVMGGPASLDLSMIWLRRLRRRKALRQARFVIAVQNGMEAGAMLRRLKRSLSPRVGVFVGGDTAWKISTMKFWAELAHGRGAICHVGRVNTPKRVRICADADVDSFDGSGPSRFAVTIPEIEAARQQPDMFAHRRIAA